MYNRSQIFTIVALLCACAISCTESKPVQPPEGMITVHAGTNKNGEKMKPFFIDVSPVTVFQFDAFVKATNYVTEAQKFGNSGVFDTTTHSWNLVAGADYLYPLGISKPAALPNQPATQISWHDAEAYCDWAHKRLPTKEEWIYAAMNADGKYNKKYPWGDSLIEKGKYKANVWEGSFPALNTVADGFAFTSPVGYFGKTPLGLTDMGGNVWEWIQDWKNPNDTIGQTAEKLQMGGSCLCDWKICHGYKIGNTSSSTPETGLCHVGFRCIKDLE